MLNELELDIISKTERKKRYYKSKWMRDKPFAPVTSCESNHLNLNSMLVYNESRYKQSYIEEIYQKNKQEWKATSFYQFTCKERENTLSGVDAPDVTPILNGPFGRKFSFSTSSPC
jgi:hypothetical protein